VHGCFWHGHDCAKGRLPKSRTDYWAPKLKANKKRDDKHTARLADLGWSSMVVWQCELRDPETVVERVKKFLDNG